MQNTVLVTAATRALGKVIVEAAVGAGLSVRQGVRTLAKASPMVPAARFDYADAGTFASAVAGVSAIVLMAQPLDASAPTLLGPVILAAKAAGVGQIVLISAFGVNHNEAAPMRVVEHLLMDSGVPYTILQPNFFMENFSEGFLAAGIRDQGAIYLAAGDGKTSLVAAQDIAAMVVAALQHGLTGKEIDLTGPEALDHTEVARILSVATGRTIVYHSLSEEQMLEGARASGMPEGAVAYLGMLYAVVGAGYAAGNADDFEAIVGRKPTSFEVFTRASVPNWV